MLIKNQQISRDISIEQLDEVKDLNWQDIINQISQSLEFPKGQENTDVRGLLNYQRELNLHHLKVELMTKSLDAFSSVLRKAEQ